MRPFCTLLVCLSFLRCTAQTSLTETLKEQIIKEWQRAKVYTDEYLNAMPANQYNFKAVDSIRSFSQQMLHLAAANVLLATMATSIADSAFQNLYFVQDLEKLSRAQNKDSVSYYVSASYDFVIKAINSLDFSKLTEIVTQRTPGGLRKETRFAWLMKAFEHQTHHRGQCTIYIRLLGIRPPAEKLF